MSDPRPFREEVFEISSDLVYETQYVATFCEDPELREVVEQMITTAHREARRNARGGSADDATARFHAGMMLLTYGFYLGREHARRGYRSPVGPGEHDSGVVPDTPAGLEGP